MLQILHVVLWNACLAAGLAVAIFLAQRIRYLRCQPNLWHALWLLVLLKLVMPPIFAIPVSMGSSSTEPFLEDHLVAPSSIDGHAMSLDGRADETLLAKTTEVILSPQFAVAVSAFGTVALLLVSFSRIRLIGRLVRHAEPSPQWMQEAAATAGRQLKLKRVPSIRTVNGIVAPFLWVVPRRPRVVVPCQLARTLDRESICLVIKHELAHYARCDHWTNALSTILGTLFWWNPVVWWARRELRILQESCCDRMVLATDTSQRCRYAEALLKTVDFVASDGAALPTPATAFGSCATFKRRLEMIVSETPNQVNSHRWQACVLFFAMVVLPLGVVHAQASKKGTPDDRAAKAKAAREAAKKGTPDDRAARARAAREASRKDALDDRAARARAKQAAKAKAERAARAKEKDARAKTKQAARAKATREAAKKGTPNDRAARARAAREASKKDTPNDRAARARAARGASKKDTPDDRAARAKAAREASKRGTPGDRAAKAKAAREAAKKGTSKDRAAGAKAAREASKKDTPNDRAAKAKAAREASKKDTPDDRAAAKKVAPRQPRR